MQFPFKKNLYQHGNRRRGDIAETLELLKLQILISFQKISPESCTVTRLAQMLAEEKYAFCHAISSLGKEGLLERSDTRHPRLTARNRCCSKIFGPDGYCHEPPDL